MILVLVISSLIFEGIFLYLFYWAVVKYDDNLHFCMSGVGILKEKIEDSHDCFFRKLEKLILFEILVFIILEVCLLLLLSKPV